MADDAVKFQVTGLLEQVEGKLSKAGYESIQSSLQSKTNDWFDELRNQIGILVKAWTVNKLPNLNYLYLVHNYLMKAVDSAPAWESTVDNMLTALQDLLKRDVKSIDKVLKVLAIWLEKGIFDKQTVGHWRKTFMKLKESAPLEADLTESTTGVAMVSDSSNSKKRTRSSVEVSDSSGPHHKKSHLSAIDEYSQALGVQTIQFLSRIFNCLHDQYEHTLRESNKAGEVHTSLNVVMFSSFYLLQHYLYDHGSINKLFDPVALAVACIFISGKSEYFFITCDRLRTVAQKYVQQCFGSSTLLPPIHQIYEHETLVLQMMGYNTSDLSAECPYIIIVKIAGEQVEVWVCRRATDLLCSDPYLQSQDCIHFSGPVIALTYLLLGDRMGNYNSKKLKDYALSRGRRFLETVQALLFKMHGREVYAESSFKDTINEVSRRVKKWLSNPELFVSGVVAGAATASTPIVTIVSESPSSVNNVHKAMSKGNTPDSLLPRDSPNVMRNGSKDKAPVSGASEQAPRVEGVAMMKTNSSSSNNSRYPVVVNHTNDNRGSTNAGRSGPNQEDGRYQSHMDYNNRFQDNHHRHPPGSYGSHFDDRNDSYNNNGNHRFDESNRYDEYHHDGRGRRSESRDRYQHQNVGRPMMSNSNGNSNAGGGPYHYNQGQYDNYNDDSHWVSRPYDDRGRRGGISDQRDPPWCDNQWNRQNQYGPDRSSGLPPPPPPGSHHNSGQRNRSNSRDRGPARQPQCLPVGSSHFGSTSRQGDANRGGRPMEPIRGPKQDLNQSRGSGNLPGGSKPAHVKVIPSSLQTGRSPVAKKMKSIPAMETEPGEVEAAGGAAADPITALTVTDNVEEGRCDDVPAVPVQETLPSPSGFLGEDDCYVTEVPDVPLMLTSVVSQPNLLTEGDEDKQEVQVVESVFVQKSEQPSESIVVTGVEGSAREENKVDTRVPSTGSSSEPKVTKPPKSTKTSGSGGSSRVVAVDPVKGSKDVPSSASTPKVATGPEGSQGKSVIAQSPMGKIFFRAVKGLEQQR